VTQGAPVVESDGDWFKSSYSGNSGCVEVCLGPTVRVRHSKDPGGQVLSFTDGEWTAFLQGVMSGEFNLRHEVNLPPEPD
jgi:hypothetical protein